MAHNRDDMPARMLSSKTADSTQPGSFTMNGEPSHHCPSCGDGTPDSTDPKQGLCSRCVGDLGLSDIFGPERQGWNGVYTDLPNMGMGGTASKTAGRHGDWRDTIGYTYDADVHCPGCAIARFGQEPGHYWVREDAVDSEGNPVHPIAPWDETSEEGEYCGTCHGQIASPWTTASKDKDPAEKDNWINYFCDECGKAHEKNKKHKHHGSADYSGWTQAGPGHEKGHVWMGNAPSDSDPGNDWIVHHKDGTTILTDSFPTEDEAYAFAQTKFVTSSKMYCPCGTCGKPCEVVGKLASKYECAECKTAAQGHSFPCTRCGERSPHGMVRMRSARSAVPFTTHSVSTSPSPTDRARTTPENDGTND